MIHPESERAILVQVGVIGPGAGDVTSTQYDLARQVGALLARAGGQVVCGGLGGVMEGVARGVREAGGTCVGVLPGHDRAEGNRYLSVAVCAGVGQKRNEMVVDSSDAIVAIGSNEGTLIEALLAKRRGVAVFGLDWSPVRVAERQIDGVVVAADPADVVARAVAAARARVVRSG
ncbi:TIGR00725 family protein [Parafrankia sp. FMc2]|uniref:TIGR00725 family protein n=1 Tax=Parafrankia sp. FMc2 TaxID=3233196 RepID=UPI0034D658E8